ncbi:MAG: hypothetical protein HFE30_01115 [Clostridiales bacterium]|nr:hypothetical protein [Clostridiales bacterium]
MELRDTYFELDNQALIPDCFGMTQEIDSKELSFFTEKPEIIFQICDLYNGNNTLSNQYQICDFSHSHERKILYKLIDFIPEKTTYFFCNVVCRRTCTVSLILSTDRYLRIWVNGELITITEGGTECVNLFHFHKGNNVICFEQLDGREHHEIGIRISPIDSENKLCSFANNGGYINKIATIYSETFSDGNTYNILYMFVPINSIKLNRKYKIHYTIEIGNKIITQNIIGLFEKCNIIIDQDELLNNNMPCLIFKYTCCQDYNNSVISSETFDMYVGSIENTVSKLIERCSYVRNTKLITNEDDLILQYYLDELKEFGSFDLNAICFLKELNKHIKRIETGKQNNIYSHGLHRIIFKSELDQNLVSYNIRVPQKYDSKVKYPLFIIFQIHHIENHYFEYSDIKSLDNVIIAEISGRGLTLGSYIGDASIKEIYNHITQLYNIDFKRIYSTGHSSGAYASWIQAQMNPHIYAGIYPSTGVGRSEMLKNLSNTAVWSLTSELDDSYKYSKANGNDKLDVIENFNEICAEQYTHPNFPYIYRNKYVINEMLTHSQVEYPHKIDFVTDRNRYLRAYWISLHSISKGCLNAKVHAEYLENIIIVECENANGIQVEVPPDIYKSCFTVIINGKQFVYRNYVSDVINYCIDTVTGSVCEIEKYDRNNFEIYKGNGLLDVYLSPLNIIKLDANSTIIEKTAKSFASPNTHTYIPTTEINYPIYSDEELSNSDFNYSSSMIILDNCCREKRPEIIDSILSKAEIKTDANGYTYGSHSCDGKYMVMQILKNPFNESTSILYINTNSEKLYQSNLFTRNVTIPSYVSGYNPYLNNSALIFNGKEYSIIKDWGMEIEVI